MAGFVEGERERRRERVHPIYGLDFRLVSLLFSFLEPNKTFWEYFVKQI